MNIKIKREQKKNASIRIIKEIRCVTVAIRKKASFSLSLAHLMCNIRLNLNLVSNIC
jgi:hypothetical protein